MKIKSTVSTTISTTILTTFLVLFAGCEKKTDSIVTSIAPEVKPSFQLLTQNNKNIDLIQTNEGFEFQGKYKNKVVLLDFFATWCPPCKAEIPHLVNLQKKYKDNFAIIGVLLEEDKNQDILDSFIREFNINYAVSNNFDNTRLSQAVGGIRTLPTMIMYDRKGNYFTHYIGAIPEEMIDRDIQRALEITKIEKNIKTENTITKEKN